MGNPLLEFGILVALLILVLGANWEQELNQLGSQSRSPLPWPPLAGNCWPVFAFRRPVLVEARENGQGVVVIEMCDVAAHVIEVRPHEPPHRDRIASCMFSCLGIARHQQAFQHPEQGLDVDRGNGGFPG